MKNVKTFTMGGRNLHLLFLTTVGSTVHKLNTENSDVDLKGVFVWDNEEYFSLREPYNLLTHNKVLKEEWAELMLQLNEEFNLTLSDDDVDVSFFELKTFFNTTLKNDFNMFDMLFSDLEPLFLSDFFKHTLSVKEKFFDSEKFKFRFEGMSKGALKEASRLYRKEELNSKQDNDLKKLSAKSLQFLFSLSNLYTDKTYNPVLKEKQRLEVLEVKKGNLNFEYAKKRHYELLEVVEEQSLLNDSFKCTSDLEHLNFVLTNTYKEVFFFLETFKNKNSKKFLKTKRL